MCMAKIMLNEAPDNNDVTCVAGNVCLTTIGAQQFSMSAIDQSCRKADIPEKRDSDTMTRKVCMDRKSLPWERIEAICPIV